MTTKKILIVDDEPHLRTLIQQSLEELEDDGVELFTATNGEEALVTIQAEEPNLVFLDVMMPRKNGFDVCNTVKNELGLKHIHIILLTEGAGIRQAARPRGGSRPLHDQTLRPGRAGCAGSLGSGSCHGRIVSLWRA
jgi:CheY-like chemotaxis protein